MKLYMDKNLGIDSEKTRLVGEFCLFCAEMLPIEGDFSIYIVSERAPYNISTTAVFNMEDQCCYIYGKNRAFLTS